MDATDQPFQALDFEPDFELLRSRVGRADLQWNNLTLRVGDKVIVDAVSGRVRPGESMCIVGPSGAGKTSLLNCLAGRVISGGKKQLAGEVLVNGVEVDPTKFRTKIAYVLQEDNLFATATGREALEFSARLRLPNDTIAERRRAIVDDLLASLGLEGVQDTMVGSELVRGMSGGEKKRVAIAVELVTQPRVLFLDEPTSGLDSFSAIRVVQILASLASSANTTVLCTIHQPSAEVFALFDRCMLLSRGRVVFNDKVERLSDVFEAHGMPIPDRTNPADYVMLLVQTTAQGKLPAHNPDADAPVQLAVQGDNAEAGEGGAEDGELLAAQTPAMLVQAFYLTQREFRRLVRDKTQLIALVCVTTFLNLLYGIIFMGAADRSSASYTAAGGFGALTIVFSSAMFGSAQGPLLTFPLDRAIMIREYQTGTYSAVPYFFSKLFVEIPQHLLTAVISMLATYWLMGFSGNLVSFVLEVWLVMLSASAYAYVLGAAATTAKQGQQLAPLVLVPQLLFTGIFLPISQIPSWLHWVQNVCALKFGINLAITTEFADCQRADCAQVIAQANVDTDRGAVYAAVLLAIGIGFRAISLAILVLRARFFSQ